MELTPDHIQNYNFELGLNVVMSINIRNQPCNELNIPSKQTAFKTNRE